MKEWFKARNAWGAGFAALPDAEAGQLAKALWQYTMTGEAPELSGAAAVLFAMLRFQLDQDEEAAQEISDARAAAGRKSASLRKQNEANSANADFVEQNPTKPTNADFVEQTGTNSANADNKNKNKNKKDIIDDDDDDDDDIRAREDAAVVDRAFRKHFSREPTRTEIRHILQIATLTETPLPLIEEAIRIAAQNGARTPALYVRKLLRQWSEEWIRTPEELQEYLFMWDAASGRNDFGADDMEQRMAEARELRKRKYGGAA